MTEANLRKLTEKIATRYTMSVPTGLIHSTEPGKLLK